MTMLQVQNLSKEFDGIKALEGLSFAIDNNSIIALTGPNGSGKTTVLNIISGFIEAEKGEVILDGINITSMKPFKIAQLGIGRTFQSIRVFSQISVLDNVMLGLKYETGDSFLSSLLQTKRMKKEEAENIKRTEELLRFVGLLEKKDCLAQDLSQGQRKILEFTRILALEPKILLLDEPTAGLFPETKSMIFSLIRKLKDLGRTILFIEHDFHSVLDIAERIIILDHGKKIAEGVPEEIRHNNKVLSAYLGNEWL